MREREREREKEREREREREGGREGEKQNVSTVCKERFLLIIFLLD